MHNALGVKDIGRIHHIPLTYSAATTFIVSVHFVTENQATQVNFCLITKFGYSNKTILVTRISNEMDETK